MNTEIVGDGWAPDQLDAMEQPVRCPDCQAIMRLRNSRHGLFYSCERFPECKTSHGAHRSGPRMGYPLGVPAPKEVRVLRITAHALANEIWPWEDRKARSKFYAWMRKKLALPKDSAHIAMLDKAQLEALIGHLEKRTKGK